jgi:hypothetical protein
LIRKGVPGNDTVGRLVAHLIRSHRSQVLKQEHFRLLAAGS